MKKKITLKMWIELAIFSGAALIFGLIFYFLNMANILDFEGSYIVTVYGFILLLIGWMSGNHVEFSYRRKEKQYGGELPLEIKQKKFSYHFPFIVAGLITLLLSFIFFYLP